LSAAAKDLEAHAAGQKTDECRAQLGPLRELYEQARDYLKSAANQ
jgi:hypothetical protein